MLFVVIILLLLLLRADTVKPRFLNFKKVSFFVDFEVFLRFFRFNLHMTDTKLRPTNEDLAM